METNQPNKDNGDTKKADTTKPPTDTDTNKTKPKKPQKQINIPPKKPKLTKQERREMQEKQRAAKAASTGNNAGNKKNNNKQPAKSQNQSGSMPVSGGGGGGSGNVMSKQHQQQGGGGGMGSVSSGHEKTPSLFSHLPPYRDHDTFREKFSGIRLGNHHTNTAANNISNNNTPSSSSSSSAASNHHQQPQLHPAVLSLGLQYANGSIRGANARCRAMLQTFQTIIADYSSNNTSNTTTKANSKTPKDIRQDLEQSLLKPSFTYWTTHCRTHSVSMGNAFTFLKTTVANIDRDTSESDAKEELIMMIDSYITQRIDFAKQVISKFAGTKIVDGDVVLTYGRSDVVQCLLEDAASSGSSDDGSTTPPKKIRLIIVDSRPLLEGRQLLKHFTSSNNNNNTNTNTSIKIEITYILLNSLSYVMMGEVTKVFLGAAALMSDGSVLSRVGTASIAMMAQRKGIPVLVCCETYKISDKVQLESITGNELGCPDDLIETRRDCYEDDCGNGEEKKDGGGGLNSGVLSNWRQIPSLKLLNLMYDLTPSEFVSGIITEMGILPPTSVAVLVREMSL